MSIGHVGKVTNDPDEVMQVIALSEANSQWGEMPGMILEYDEDRQTASIRPLYRPTVRGVIIPIPDLLDVPVRFPRTQRMAITIPIRMGDVVTLRPMMRSTEEYHDGGSFGNPRDQRYYSLADMEAHLDGCFSLRKSHSII